MPLPELEESSTHASGPAGLIHLSDRLVRALWARQERCTTYRFLRYQSRERFHAWPADISAHVPRMQPPASAQHCTALLPLLSAPATCAHAARQHKITPVDQNAPDGHVRRSHRPASIAPSPPPNRQASAHTCAAPATAAARTTGHSSAIQSDSAANCCVMSSSCSSVSVSGSCTCAHRPAGTERTRHTCLCCMRHAFCGSSSHPQTSAAWRMHALQQGP